MFGAEYVDSNGIRYSLGAVKIGKKDIGESDKKPITGRVEIIDLLPEEFRLLDLQFFSLGQSDDYYETIKKLGDQIREDILGSLNDIAYNEELFNEIENLPITQKSILRSISSTTVRGQYHRIARGGVRLTEYDFTYYSSEKQKISPYELSFKVIPESNPPSNIHVLIGRNGVGKTYLIRNMIKSLENDGAGTYGHFQMGADNEGTFANIVCVAFSAFDEFPTTREDNAIPYLFVGLEQDYDQTTNGQKTITKSRMDKLQEQFQKSLLNCIVNQAKKKLWLNAISTLESDPVFKDSNIRSIDVIKDDKLSKSKNCGKIFRRLSSGHKIILLTITQLVEKVEESTLVLLDEPETHLHPPLLSAFIRALSDLLINRNGVAIITTHSPVVLQEVPNECVWKLWRSGSIMKTERLEVETFGENVGSLINEVFGLEVTDSGFHKILSEAVCKYNANYDVILSEIFNKKLGSEARAILKALTIKYSEDEE